MAENDDNDQVTGVRSFAAEGARVGIVTCKVCGAAILLDPADDFDSVALHREWHGDLQVGQVERGEDG